MRIALAALLLLTPAAWAAENPACAKFENPLAYNACLAKQGPRADAVRSGAAPREAVGPRRAFGAPVRRGPHGRVRMDFSVTPRR